MIGIGITEHNRPKVLKKSLEYHRKHLPKNAKLVIVDDASTMPLIGADYRFEHNAGIAAAKNKCIELLSDCEHIFLFDSDTYPIVENWHLSYIDSGIKHLSFTFPKLASGRPNGRVFKNTRNGITEYESPCGCMLYIHRSVIDTIGGFDVDYPQWGFEHVDFSQRAFNAGLTYSRYLDVSNSLELLCSLDYMQSVNGSTPTHIRSIAITENKKRLRTRSKSREFMPYRSNGKGIVLAAYLNSLPDPQRKDNWMPDVSKVAPLIDSCIKNGVDYRIFHDCIDTDDPKFVKVSPQYEHSPNAWRWFLYHDWVKSNPHDNIFMVDSTDVEMLRNPFVTMNPNRLYVGDEFNMRVDNGWMRRNQEPYLKSLKDYRHVISTYSREVLINCGIVGGGRDVVMEYLEKRVSVHEKHTKGVTDSTDMAIFNYICWKYFKDRLTSGLKVNTKFKQFERNGISFFKHK